MPTSVRTSPDTDLLEGPTKVNGLPDLAQASYRVAVAKITAYGRPRPEDAVATEELRRRFSTRDIYALWHWIGGAAATAGDLELVFDWLVRESDFLYAVIEDAWAYTKSRDRLARLIASAMRGSREFEDAAAALADICEGIAADCTDFVDYDEETGEVGDDDADPHNVMPLIELMYKLAKFGGKVT